MELKDYMKKERYNSRHLCEAVGISLQHAYQISRGITYASPELAMKIQEWTKNKVKAQKLMRPKVCPECGRSFKKNEIDIKILPIEKNPL